jgi:hypothetical protein
MFADPRGRIESITPDFAVTGYTWDPDNASRSLLIQVRVDNVAVYEGRAEISRPDVNQQFGITGRHGFRVDIPRGYLGAGDRHTVTVLAHDTSTSHWETLSGSGMAFRNQPPTGYFDAIDTTTFVASGWAVDQDVPDKSILVEFCIDGNCLDRVRTAEARTDVNAALGVGGYHGFTWQIPAAYRNGGEHTLRVWAIDDIDGSRHQLGASPKSFRNRAPIGYFDGVTTTDNMMHGWAFDWDDVGRALQVEIRVDGEAIATVPSGDPRSDVNQVFGIGGNHGWNFAIPSRFWDNREHTLAALAIDPVTGAKFTVGGSPQTIRLRPIHNKLYLAFDGYSISRADLQRWAGDEWSDVISRFDPEGDGIRILPVGQGSPQHEWPTSANREPIIDRIMRLVQIDVAPFGITVERLRGPVVEGMGQTTIFVGRSTLPSRFYHVANEIDAGNHNRTDIAFVGNEWWGSDDRTALAMADVVIHEAGHTWGLYHVESDFNHETMGLRYSTPQSFWLQDTGFLNRTFTVRPGHGPSGTQNSYRVLVDTFGQFPQSAHEAVTLDLTLPGDMDNDGDIDRGDFARLVSSFGSSTPPQAADLDGDGRVGIRDLGLLRDRLGFRPRFGSLDGESSADLSAAADIAMVDLGDGTTLAKRSDVVLVLGKIRRESTSTRFNEDLGDGARDSRLWASERPHAVASSRGRRSAPRRSVSPEFTDPVFEGVLQLGGDAGIENRIALRPNSTVLASERGTVR